MQAAILQVIQKLKEDLQRCGDEENALTATLRALDDTITQHDADAKAQDTRAKKIGMEQEAKAHEQIKLKGRLAQVHPMPSLQCGFL